MLGGKKSDATRKSWKLFSTPPTLGGGRGGEGCSLPVAHQSGRSTILNISGNSLDLFVNVLRVFLILTVHWGRRSAPHLWEGLDRPHCMVLKTTNIFRPGLVHSRPSICNFFVFFYFDSALGPEICSSPLGRTRPTTLYQSDLPS